MYAILMVGELSKIEYELAEAHLNTNPTHLVIIPRESALGDKIGCD